MNVTDLITPVKGAVARPPSFRTRRLPYVAALLIMLTLVPLQFPGAYELSIANRTITYAVAAIGFYLVFGLSGQFAFSQAIFFGLGAYASAWSGRTLGGFWLALVVGVVITALVAVVFALLVRKADHFYFAIATLGLSEIGLVVFTEWESFTGSAGQVQVVDDPSIAGFVFDSELRMFWFLLGALALVLVLTAWIERSPVRRDAIVVRDHPEVAASFGMPTLKVQLVMFVLGSSYAGAAGALFAHDQGFISPSSFSVALGINIFLMVILGGLGSMWGAVIGAIFVVLFPSGCARSPSIGSSCSRSC
ncbi:MAG: branched-chain amino acid ABC transporter permease [Xanthomonadales bacterium]|nr:branched-chain amino acid ABC transporter permease [Xanthomonadales bacterium]